MPKRMLITSITPRPPRARFGIDANPLDEALEALIDWKLQSPKHLRLTGNRMTAITEGKHMQRQFNIELRVDYEDSGKNDEMRKACAAAARHMFAMANLLADGVKPQVSIYSDDYFQGTQAIELMEDTIAEGQEQTGLEDAPVSSELLGAVRDQE